MPIVLIGVDFSGAVLAGEKIWVSRAEVKGESLQFDFLNRASNLPGGAPEREAALSALRMWLLENDGAKCGFDFPFALIREAIPDPSYADWLKAFAQRYPTAEALKENAPDGRRACDIAAKTPFSPLNLRLYRQTYYGIRDVLAPLNAAGAQILPFDDAGEDRTWLLEICPASWLKREKLYISYKGKSVAQRKNREIIAHELAQRMPVLWSDEIYDRAMEDTEGDALDALLSAICVFNALQKPEELKAQLEIDRFEGKVYF